MSFQLLISTIDKTDYELLAKMNVNSDAIVVNQCHQDSMEEFDYNGHKIKWINMSGRGVGLSRNTALQFATADIVLFADDDMIYNDDYQQKVIQAFENNLKADVICFNIDLVSSSKNFDFRKNKKDKQLNLFNSMKYGACRIAARRRSLWRERISFSLLFGGGAELCCGEDSLFIRDCYKRKLQLYANSYTLGEVYDGASTWFKGINDKLFIDRGAFIYNAFPKLHWLLFFYYAFRMKNTNENYSMKKIIRLFKCGKKTIKTYR